MKFEQALEIVRGELVSKLDRLAHSLDSRTEPIGDYVEINDGFVDLTVRVSIGNEDDVVRKYGQEVYDALVREE